MAAPMRLFKNIKLNVYNHSVFSIPLSIRFRTVISCACNVSTFYNNSVRLKCVRVASTSYSTGGSQTTNDKDVERLFIRVDVQAILKKITGFDIEKIFRVRPMKDLKPPEYKLLTDAELDKLRSEAEVRARSFLQMPPVMNAWHKQQAAGGDKQVQVLSEDKLIENFESGDCKYVFTDISNDVPYRRRAVAVRELSGILRVADPKERERILNIYFPREGKSHKMPQMFEEEQLEKVLAEHRYEYILDRACNQFEPDDPEYIRVTQRTYEHIASRNRFDDLRSTRHFGPMSFYLTYHKKIDLLLVDMLQRDLLEDGTQLIQLYHIVHPECISAERNKTKAVKDPVQLILLYAKNDSKEEGIIELALQSYEQRRSKSSMSATSSL